MNIVSHIVIKEGLWRLMSEGSFEDEKLSLLIHFNTTENILYDAFANLVLHASDKMTPVKYINSNQSIVYQRQPIFFHKLRHS